MLGIDIVDLHDPLLRKRTKRSLGLVSNESDQHIDHPQLFWLLWTAKEAVFKVKRKAISFAPTEIPIKLKQKKNLITFESDELKGSFEISDSHILAIAHQLDGQLTHKVFNEKADDWSVTIREKISMHLREEKLQYQISSDENGLPKLIPGNIPVSFSHHGKFGAFAYPTSFLNR